MTLIRLLPLFAVICFRPTSVVGVINFVIGLSI
jgi:hypothetical protein